MKKLLTKNIGLKALSLFLALLLWMVVVNIEDPTIRRTLTIPVDLINQDLSDLNDKIIKVVQGNTVDITVKGKRTIIDNLRTSDFRAVGDLKDMYMNAASIKVTTSKNVELINQSPQNLRVELDNIKKIQVTVQARLIGEVADHHVILPEGIVVTPNRIEVTGPETQINQIATTEIVVDVDGSSSDVIFTKEPAILDANGKILPDITTNVQEVKAEVKILMLKDVPVTMKSVGDVQNNYRMTNFSYEPSSVTIVGRAQDLEKIKEIPLPDYNIDGLNESTTESFSLNDKFKLPSNVQLYNKDETINLKITVERLMEKVVSIPLEKINVSTIPSNLQFSFAQQTPIEIIVKGLSSDLVRLDDISRLNPRIDLTGLQAGVHNLPVTIVLGNQLVLIGEAPTVNIELVEEDEEDNLEESEDLIVP